MKHKKKETQQRMRNKGGMKQLVFVLGCWPLSGQNPARDKGQTTI